MILFIASDPVQNNTNNNKKIKKMDDIDYSALAILLLKPSYWKEFEMVCKLAHYDPPTDPMYDKVISWLRKWKGVGQALACIGRTLKHHYETSRSIPAARNAPLEELYRGMASIPGAYRLFKIDCGDLPKNPPKPCCICNSNAPKVTLQPCGHCCWCFVCFSEMAWPSSTSTQNSTTVCPHCAQRIDTVDICHQ